MRRLRILAAMTSLICLAAMPAAAARDDFYLNLLHRGMAHVDAGQYDAALRELHIAAFGLVDTIPQFEIAHIYLTIAGSGLKNEAEARRSAQRVVAAERLDRQYGSLSIPQSARKKFEDIASKLLTNDQYAFLRSSPAGSAATPQPVTPAPMPAPQPVAPQPRVVAPAPQPVPPPAPAPRETTIVVPMPAPQPVPTAPAPQPRVVQPAPQPVPKPVQTQPVQTQPVQKPVQTQPAQTQPVQTQPVPQPKPAPVIAPVQPAPRAIQPAPQPRPKMNVDAQLTLADTAIERDDLSSATRVYRSVLEEPTLTHEQLLRIGEGAYRARDFADSVRALERSGFRSGEEPYRYYYAVGLYETGDYAAAKKELALALPYIEVTRDIARYRTKIEGAAP